MKDYILTAYDKETSNFEDYTILDEEDVNYIIQILCNKRKLRRDWILYPESRMRPSSANEEDVQRWTGEVEYLEKLLEKLGYNCKTKKIQYEVEVPEDTDEFELYDCLRRSSEFARGTIRRIHGGEEDV